jgi:hypothetical protein
MSKFPLYNSLSKDLQEGDLSDIQKRTFLKRIEKIDKNGYELIYALIRMYQIENKEENINFTLPYGGENIDNNIHFDLENFPIKLKQVLFKFVSIHLEKMKEEVMMSSTPVKRV